MSLLICLVLFACLFNHSSSCAYSISYPAICIMGKQAANNWFYTQYNYSGCFNEYPTYRSTENNHYIFYSTYYNRWESYTYLDNKWWASPYDHSRGIDLFDNENSKWVVSGHGMGLNVDPCLQIHPSSCSEATQSNSCDNCTMQYNSICITGNVTKNNWFYGEYNYSGCFGPNPYYSSTQNNSYLIYYNYYYNRWTSMYRLGNAVGEYDKTDSNDLFDNNAVWMVYDGENKWNYAMPDPCLRVHPSSCSNTQNNITTNVCHACMRNVTKICVSGSEIDNNWFYTQYNLGGCYGNNPYYYSNINKHYIYFRYDSNWWEADTMLGPHVEHSHAIYSAHTGYYYDDITNNLLYNSNGQWIVNGSSDVSLVIHVNCITQSPTTTNPTSSPITASPTKNPTDQTIAPSISPITSNPTEYPSNYPSNSPTINPSTMIPTINPTIYPSEVPSIFPTTLTPTYSPSNIPTFAPWIESTAFQTSATWMPSDTISSTMEISSVSTVYLLISTTIVNMASNHNNSSSDALSIIIGVVCGVVIILGFVLFIFRDRVKQYCKPNKIQKETYVQIEI